MKDVFSGCVTLNELAGLKPEWKVSIASLVYRATKLKAINDNQTRNLWRDINVRAWRRQEPASLDFEAETPALIKTLFHADRTVVAEKLHINTDRLEEMYGLTA